MKQLEIPGKNQPLEAILSEVDKPIAMLILAHGAGAGMNHSFMENLTNQLGNEHITVVRFNFPYLTSGKKFPSSPKPNIQAWNDIVNWVSTNFDLPIFIGGKSYGGRMASHMLVENNYPKVKGAIFYGFPLHAPGRDSITRADHLSKIKVPLLFLQGTRDALANFDLIQQIVIGLPHAVLKDVQGGDHSFKVKGSKPIEIANQLAGHTSIWIQGII